MKTPTVCNECGIKFESQEFVFRHIRSHNVTVQEYVLKYHHNGVIPVCHCGCFGKTTWNVGLKNYTTFVRGHHAFGRIKSAEEKAKIGAKNSVNMKRWMARHPDIAKRKGELMLAHRTPEVEARRIESTKKTYTSMTPEDKQKFSDHTKRLWADGILSEARSKAAETYKQRYADGSYDFTERNDKISATITQRYLDGGFAWSTGQYTSIKTGAVCNYRSSWEKMYMEELDSRDDVETWKYEPMSLPYFLEGKLKRYIPDFQVILSDGSCLLVEVKPASLVGTDMNEAKHAAALDFCMKNGWKYMTWSPEDAAT